jgi:hypothetical protein
MRLKDVVLSRIMAIFAPYLVRITSEENKISTFDKSK